MAAGNDFGHPHPETLELLSRFRDPVPPAPTARERSRSNPTAGPGTWPVPPTPLVPRPRPIQPIADPRQYATTNARSTVAWSGSTTRPSKNWSPCPGIGPDLCQTDHRRSPVSVDRRPRPCRGPRPEASRTHPTARRRRLIGISHEQVRIRLDLPRPRSFEERGDRAEDRGRRVASHAPGMGDLAGTRPDQHSPHQPKAGGRGWRRTRDTDRSGAERTRRRRSRPPRPRARSV